MPVPTYEELTSGADLPSYDELTRSEKTPSYEELTAEPSSEFGVESGTPNANSKVWSTGVDLLQGSEPTPYGELPQVSALDAPEVVAAADAAGAEDIKAAEFQSYRDKLNPLEDPRPGVGTAALGRLTAGITNAAAGAIDLTEEESDIIRPTAGDPLNQRRLDVVRQRLSDLSKDPNSNTGEIQTLSYEAKKLSRPLRENTFAGKLSRTAANATADAERVPGTLGSIARGVGTVGSFAPAMLLGPGGVAGFGLASAQAVAEAESAGRTGQADAMRAQGVTSEIEIEDASKEAGMEAASHAALTMPVYLMAGKVGADVAGRIMQGASRVATVAAETVAATGVNVGMGALIRSLEGQEAAPNMEQFTMDALWGVVHGLGVNVSEKAKARARGELASRGWAQHEIDNPTSMPERFITGKETPASRVMAAPEKVQDFTGAARPESPEMTVGLSTVNEPSKPSVKDIVPAIRVGEEVVRGNVGETHEDVLTRFREENPDREADALMGFDSKENPNFFVDANGRELSRDQLEKEFGARDSQKLRELQAAEPERNLGPGAANIEEFQPSKPLGAKNAMVDEQRAARGLEPLTSEPRKKWGVVWDAVEQRAEKDPTWTERVVDEVSDGTKKSVTDEEQAGLEWRMIDLHNKRVDAETRAADEQTYSPEERADFDSQVEKFEKELQRTEEANRKIGTQSGRALAIRKLIAYEDFTLAAMESRARRSKGEVLTPEERTAIKTESEQAQKAQKVIKDAEDAAETGIDESIRAIEAEAAKDPEFSPEVRGLADRIITKLDKAAKGASERLKALMSQIGSQFGSAPDVAIVAKIVKEMSVLAASEIGKVAVKGTLKFTRWAADMVSRFGKGVEPYLDRAWKQADASIDAEVAGTRTKKPKEVKAAITKEKVAATAESLGEKMKARAAEGEKITKMTGDIDKLVRTLVAGGIKNRDALTDAVHDVLKTVDPAVTRRQAMDAISKYGDFKPLSKDEVSKTVRDLKQQLQLASKIEDVMAKTPLKRTGIERQPLSDEGRKMTKQLNELARELGIKITDPATQLKSIIGALETRLTNRIKDLKGEIAKGERTVKTRTPPPTSEKIESLRRELAEVEAQHEALLGKKGMSEEQRLKAYTSRTQKRIAEIERRLKEGDFEPPAKRKPLDLSKDPAAVKAKATLTAIEKQFNERRLQWLADKRSTLKKGVDWAKEAVASTRTLTTSGDLSAPFRQGGFYSIGDLVFNPVRLGRQMGQMFRSAVSERGFQEQQAALKLRPNAELYKDSGLYIADIDPSISNRGLNFTNTEESMRGNLAEKIPLVGRVVRGSNRAYAAFLNRQRADAFDAFVQAVGGKDAISPQDAQFLAKAVNDLTGRGHTRQKDAAAMNWLAKYLFSPRFLASRINVVLGAPMLRGKWTGTDAVSLKARLQVGKQYAKTAAALGVLYGLATLFGATVEKDPRSTDFGKIRMGKTRIDPMSGVQQVMVLATRGMTGKQKVGSGEVKPTTFATLGNFIRGKLAPVPAGVVDLTFGGGKNVIGEKVTPGSAALNAAIPMSFQDTGELFREHGATKASVIQMLNLLGFGTSTYETKGR